MNYQAIIFDLDGVLVSTDCFHYLAWKEIADGLQVPFDEEINQQLRGVSRADSLRIILEHGKKIVSTEEKERLLQEKNDKYRRMLSQMSYKDVDYSVRETLEELKKRGFLIAVGSSSKNTKYILEKVNLDNTFHVIVDGTDITKSKPDPEVFLKASMMLKVEPVHCMVVEDASAGIEAAKAAGMFAIELGERKMDVRADCHIREIKELMTLPQLKTHPSDL